jgi:hypothetical protein
MRRSLILPGAIAAVAIVLAAAPKTHALLNSTVQPCRAAVAKYSGKFVNKKMKTIQKCNNKNLKVPGDCPPAELAASIAALEQKMRDGIIGKCALPASILESNLSYPGKCPDPNPANGFTSTDLRDCMVDAHEDAVDDLIAIQYNIAGPIVDSLLQKCQEAIAKNAWKLTNARLKAVQKCRDAVDKGDLNIPGSTCATGDVKTAEKIAKAESKARAGIAKKCTATQVQTLDICSDPACDSAIVPSCSTCDVTCAGDCIVASHSERVDTTRQDFSDLIDFEYATQPNCGDGVINVTAGTPKFAGIALAEECDKDDDDACPGLCGDFDGPFGCLCTNIPRERVIEHKEADLDNGWRGDSHDSGIVEGGGYVSELHDCDGPSGPDTLCNVGPTCSGAPHSPCVTDTQCAGIGQGTCRRTDTATGPHCAFDPKTTCNLPYGDYLNQAQCPGTNNYCKKTFHGPPLPLSAGGIQVCVLNIFTEDVTGTRDLADGSAAVHIRQASVTHLTGTPEQPCPICGGFCQAPQGGDRHKCETNADCADVPPSICVTANVCSFGPKVDQTCRPDPPFGGPTELFGNPSVDCPPDIGADISFGGLDIEFNPATTGTVTKLPTLQCDETGFTDKRCMGGTSDGRTCTVASECPGGTCSFQCFCANGGSVKQRPNGCDAACVGGTSDAFPCVVDSECPGGFCHPADCRPDTGAPLFLQPHEGACTTTTEGHCSASKFRTCDFDTDCQAPSCSFCETAPLETCVVVGKNCFINSGITRVGVADVSDPVSAAVFCIAQTGTASVDGTAGLPGPGALRQPSSTALTGFAP